MEGIVKSLIGIIALILCAGVSHVSYADTIVISGYITQSSQDGTGPAVNNASLNNIADGDSWQLSLLFDGAILAPGTYSNLTNSSLTLSDPSAGASENDFDFTSLTISQVGGFDQFSLFGCLNTGGGCFAGNDISASFQIASFALNSQNVAATGLDQPHPLDLLEDDGTTDIQGSITGYSYTSTAAIPQTPEPSSVSFLSEGIALFCAASWGRLRRK